MSKADDILLDDTILFPEAAEDMVNFWLKYARFQALKAENEELNRVKREIRPWGSKRQLVSPALEKAAKAKRQPSPGAPLKSRNHFKHGRYSAETLAFWATVAACVKASRAMADEAMRRFPESKRGVGRPRSATRQSV